MGEVNGEFKRPFEKNEVSVPINKENKRRRADKEKTIQIADRRLSVLSADDICVVQDVISEHVRGYYFFIIHFYKGITIMQV